MSDDRHFKASCDPKGWYIDCGLGRKARVTASGKVNKISKGISSATPEMLDTLQFAAASLRISSGKKHFGGPTSSERWAACHDIAARANTIAAERTR